LAIIEAERNFTQEKMEELFGQSPVVVEPVFGITPKALNAIQMVSPLRLAFLLAYDDMATPDRQGAIGVPVIGVIQAARPGGPTNERQETFSPPTMNGEDPHQSVSLKDPQHDNLSGRTPPPFSAVFPSEHRLVAFNRSSQGIAALLVNGQHSPNESEVPFEGRRRGRTAKSQPVNRYPKNKVFHQLSLGSFRKSEDIPDRRKPVPLSTSPAFKPAIAQLPSPVMPTR